MEAKLGLGGCLWALPGVLWVNHPARQSDLRKPDQLVVAKAAGMRVPRSLVTNRADAVRRFAADVDGPIVVKPLGYGSILEDGGRRAMYTRVLTDDDLADLAGVEATAHLFQQYVDKAYEVRLTVVGTGDDARLFPVAIHATSDAARVDFRSDYDSLAYSVVDVPDEVEVGVRAFMARFGITLGHFDFCVDHAGAHWFLECNGSGGQYGFVEKATGLPITDSIADLLRKGSP
jgi:glutathione synthase/RimK-type ligase-like ATP-grasp enzyme